MEERSEGACLVGVGERTGRHVECGREGWEVFCVTQPGGVRQKPGAVFILTPRGRRGVFVGHRVWMDLLEG